MNTKEIVLRRASVDDAVQIFAVKRSVFGSTSLPYTIYQAEQSLNYLKDIIPTDRFVLAVLASEVVGYYHAIRREDALFLNYIATKLKHRGNCIGTRLLRDYQTAAECAGVAALELDVFESNAGAVSWYKNNGFKVVRGTHWYRMSTRHVFPVEVQATVVDFELGRAFAEEGQRGFSRIACCWLGRKLLIGLIAGHTCKLLESYDAAPQNVAGMILSLFPSRKYLVLSSPEPLKTTPSFVGHEHSFRMRKTL
jgi:ribosomal protein S18 acetylase RimI-like enzyme